MSGETEVRSKSGGLTEQEVGLDDENEKNKQKKMTRLLYKMSVLTI